MTLGGWYKRYIYIPLGGSKVGAWRWVFNTAIVWLITGIWHGNTIGFIVWGMSYFVLLLLEKFTGIRDKASKHLLVSFLYRIFMLCMINFLWVIFYFGEMNQAIVYIRNMLFFQGNDISVDRFKYLLSNYWIIIFVAIIFATPLFTYLKKKMIGSYVGETFYVARILAIGLCFIVAVANVIAGSSNNFIYIGF